MALPLAIPLFGCTPLRITAAADACASGESIGLGGWFGLNEELRNPAAARVYWFSLQLKVTDFPPDWEVPPDAQKSISAWELLAQLILLIGIVATFGPQGRVRVTSASDNVAAVAAGGKLFSTAFPLALILQLLAGWSAALRTELVLDHIPGAANVLADGLSRDDAATTAAVSEPKRFRVSLKELIAMRRSVPVFPPRLAPRVPRSLGVRDP